MFGRRLFTTLVGFLQKVGSLKAVSQQSRVHNYTTYKLGRDYAFDEFDNGFQANMTAYGRNIKRGDYILISRNNREVRYKVEQIDYYSNPSDLWIALLVRS